MDGKTHNITPDINLPFQWSLHYCQMSLTHGKSSQDIALIYQKAADLFLKKRNTHRIYKQKSAKNSTHQNQIHYSNLRKQLKDLVNLFDKYPKDPFIRGKYFHLKRNFRRILKKYQTLKKKKILQKIQEMEEKNPEAFWKLVNSIKNNRVSGEDFDPEIIYDYFKTLHKGIKNDHLDINHRNIIETKLSSLKKQEWVDILDKSISQEEIMKVVKHLKNRKSCSFDSITNEMIKCSVNIMANPLLKAFNHVLHSEKIP